MNVDKVNHLKIVVELLDQLNKASLYSKRWCVSLCAVFLALASQVEGMEVSYLAFFPILFLWVLDAQNARQEALLHRLYERVRRTSEDQIDFDIRTEPLKTPKDTVLRYLLDADTCLFYGAMLFGVFIIDWAVR